ncbi:MAG: nucleotide exchange factor GrpE [Clostridia bacterium]|nr:nucleotide exchange factor GrpE [Clostridia bacterium]
MAEEKNMDKIDFEESAPETDASESDHKDKKEKRSEVKKLKTEIEDLKKALEAEKARADETNDKYLRLAAEYDNFRKRTQADRKNIYTDAVSETLGGLLPTIDNLQYAAKYSGGDAEKVAEGLNMILSKLPETLEKMNIKAFGEPGETFDPNIHNAILHVDDESLGEGEIVEVLQQGYMYGERVLRYAMVKVAN